MIISFLKYQFRQGLFLIPFITIPLVLIMHHYVWVFLFLQGRFFRVIQQNDFNFSLVHITGSDLKLPLKAYNLSWTAWFNVWFFIAKIIDVNWLENSIRMALIEIIDFNALLFVSFIVGNTLTNSDLITLKSSILKWLGASFIFGITISLFYLLLTSITTFSISPFVNILLFLSSIITWRYHLQQQNKINYIRYYL